jgi:AraC-like DNA-binding protein
MGSALRGAYARRRGSPSSILGRFLAAYALILLLPTALALVFYRASAQVILRGADAIAAGQLEEGLETLNGYLSGLKRSAARLASDYDINLYLNRIGPLDGISEYNLKRISDKLAPLTQGSDPVAHCFIYFAGSAMVAYEGGFSAYDSFYGPVFSVDGMGPAEFKAAFLGAAGGERLELGLGARFDGQPLAAIAAIWPLGYGEYNRGALVALLDQERLIAPLEALASANAGWAALLAEDGRVIAAAGPGPLPPALSDTTVGHGVRRLSSGGRSYRAYHSSASSVGWRYAAALDESSLLAEARRVRDLALILLGLALALGSAASYALAARQARPLSRLISLALRAGGAEERGRGGVYQRAEEAILALSHSRDTAKAEAGLAAGAARAYFLRRLLEGFHRDRQAYIEEARRFGLDLEGGPRYVLLCGASGPLGPEGGLDAEELAGAANLGQGEYGLALSPGEAAFILRGGAESRRAAQRLAAALREAAGEEQRSGLVFAAGDDVQDAFLIQASYLQARAALGRMPAGSLEPVFYSDLPVSPGGLRFPLDLEESILRAVRSANVHLLEALLGSLRRENFEERGLPAAEAGDLAVGLRLAALRLLPEYPLEAAGLRERLYARGGRGQERALFDEACAVLREMSELSARRMRGHSRELARKVRFFIEQRFSSKALGLAMVAEAHRLSENYLSNVYKEQEGECVSETIEKVRMREARRLLARGGMSVDAVAERCGYSSGVSFRRAFKRAEGISPSEYRKAAGVGQE